MSVLRVSNSTLSPILFLKQSLKPLMMTSSKKDCKTGQKQRERERSTIKPVMASKKKERELIRNRIHNLGKNKKWLRIHINLAVQ